MVIKKHRGMKRKYRQIIQIGKNVTDIFHLPCVIRIEKLHNGDPVYLLATGADMRENWANVGDSICEDYGGNWHVIPNNI